MTDFKIEETRVVIVGQDPVGGAQGSSGYAYHKSNSFSTKHFVRKLEKETSLLNELGVPDLELDPIFVANYYSTPAECDFSWWVGQSKQSTGS